MYLAGVSVRRVEDISEALWGTKVSPGTISNLNKKAYGHIETWRTRPLVGSYPYVYVDGVYLKHSWGGEIQNVSILVAIGASNDGYRQIIGAAEGMKEDKESWRSFFVWLKGRGLTGARLVIGNKNLGMLETISEVFPDARYQRCMVHFYRENSKSWYCSDYKSDNCSFTVWKHSFGTQFTADDLKLLLAGKTTKTKPCTSKNGNKFSARFKLAGGSLEPVFEKLPEKHSS